MRVAAVNASKTWKLNSWIDRALAVSSTRPIVSATALFLMTFKNSDVRGGMTIRIVMPPLTSEFLNVIKNSAVALTIGLVELTASARSIQEFSFQVFEAFTAATLIYMALNLIVVIGMRRLERRLAVPGLIGSGPAMP